MFYEWSINDSFPHCAYYHKRKIRSHGLRTEFAVKNLQSALFSGLFYVENTHNYIGQSTELHKLSI